MAGGLVGNGSLVADVPVQDIGEPGVPVDRGPCGRDHSFRFGFIANIESSDDKTGRDT